MESFKNTKIVCSLGPACAAESVLREMVRAGMDVARVNFSYGDIDVNIELIEKAREAAKAEGRPLAILQDLQGPKIRVGELPENGVELGEGAIVTFRVGVKSAGKREIPVVYDRLALEVKRGDRILLSGGEAEVEVMGTTERAIEAKVLMGGRVHSYHSISVPSAYLSAEAFTEKDERDLAMGLKHNVDYVALSFVRQADDVLSLKERIHKSLPEDTEEPAVVAKIEKQEALDNFDEILKEADAIMIARGDLGIETSVAAVPVKQKELIAKCVVAGKPVITATQMLYSMINKKKPTRAEVSDVANSVIDHTDAVMLSEETAMGRYPVRVVMELANIIEKTEEFPLKNLQPHRDAKGQKVPFAVAAVAVELARHVDAKAIIVTTRSGYSALAVSRFRPEVPILAATDNPRTQNRLMLSWGVAPFMEQGYENPESYLEKSLKAIKKDFVWKKGDKLVVVSGLKRKKKGYDSIVRVAEV